MLSTELDELEKKAKKRLKWYYIWGPVIIIAGFHYGGMAGEASACLLVPAPF